MSETATPAATNQSGTQNASSATATPAKANAPAAKKGEGKTQKLAAAVKAKTAAKTGKTPGEGAAKKTAKTKAAGTGTGADADKKSRNRGNYKEPKFPKPTLEADKVNPAKLAYPAFEKTNLEAARKRLAEKPEGKTVHVAYGYFLVRKGGKDYSLTYHPEIKGTKKWVARGEGYVSELSDSMANLVLELPKAPSKA